MKIAEPTLSSGGWITDPSARLAKAFVYFMTSEYDQTNDFIGEVVSIPYIIATHGNNPEECASIMQQKMRRSLERRFDSVTIEVTHEFEDDEINYRLKIDARVIHDGKGYNMGRSIGVDGQNLTHKLLVELNK